MAQPPPGFFGGDYTDDTTGKNNNSSQWGQSTPQAAHTGQQYSGYGGQSGAQPSIFNPVSLQANSQQQQQAQQHQQQNDLHHRHVSGQAGASAVAPQEPGGSKPAVFDPASFMASAMSGGAGASGGNPLQNAVMENIAKGVFAAGKENVSNPGLLVKYIPGASIFYASMRYYFNVDNKYVSAKFRLLLFPFRNKAWSREQVPSGTDGQGAMVYAPPVKDSNAPDLYLPLMSVVTYILLVGLLKGTRMTFTPQVLSDSFNSSVATMCLELVLTKLGLYFLSPGISVPMLDLVSYSGYKFVLVSLNMVVGITLGWTAYTVALVYSCAAMSFFIMRTMQWVIPEPSIDVSGGKRRLYLLGLFCALQCLTIWWMGYTRDFKSMSLVSAAVGGSGVTSAIDTTAVAGGAAMKTGVAGDAAATIAKAGLTAATAATASVGA